MNYTYTLPLKSDEVKKNFNKNKKGVPQLHLFLIIVYCSNYSNRLETLLLSIFGMSIDCGQCCLHLPQLTQCEALISMVSYSFCASSPEISEFIYLIIYGKHAADFNALWAVGAIIASCARDCFSVVYNSCNFFADGILMFIKFSKTRKRA